MIETYKNSDTSESAASVKTWERDGEEIEK